ncbi:2-amino-4-hydroxy-6-hydroxymethyldihydropteridine diphosphokinase [[Mycobacterium] crassicus]|uniref:2-amino-4-hydroxy-6-hydroxymethyldihydropteridine diphosphokinase n=1 Tax=[Mycobacterium] crassicus TaxID=2872309 RepID=A0ABU5XI71_9MYCO|nr:2-amino-4-hydroxy-6-hydroxymethyldihydropteridine diphosphokinase [Mycolicibacter sp. MYC098]MEB3021603.1 2-amino-4-hydroxy-6-hydroxymethyldihydropteridine diphosphokinase [Mycolicibacter sp. MYC098]
MTRAVLSIGSNLGDRLARLQSAVDGFGAAVRAVSGVYETEAWGAVDQGRFLNAVLIVEDPAVDGPGWLRWAHELEHAADRVRGERWGPRTLDIDVISCCDITSDEPGGTELLSRDNGLTLPHPLAHLRAFVMVPWLAVEPDARLTVTGQRCAVADLLNELEPADRTGPRLTDLVLERREWSKPAGDG